MTEARCYCRCLLMNINYPVVDKNENNSNQNAE